MADVDVMLFGPTGVTGREVARHLARRASALGLTWGVAGRDRERVAAALDELALEGGPDLVMTADAGDPASVAAMVDAASVVANLVGPYARHGETIYAACARTGTDQLDLTGEMPWVRSMLDRYHEAAVASGARIVPTAGFESLPYDLAALLAATTLHERTGDPVVAVDASMSTATTSRVTSLTDAVSGGTYQSIVTVLGESGGASMTDPHLLDPGAAARSGVLDLVPRRHPATGEWLGPMAPWPWINPVVVHRSAALLRDAGEKLFAEDFRYRDGAEVGPPVPGPGRPVAAATMAGATAAMGLLGRLPQRPRRALAGWMGRIGPQAGSGPRPEDLDAWSYRITARAATAAGEVVDVVVEADGHPGYKSTARMIGEAALALADGSPVPDRRGFLTPATALGTTSIERMAEAGLRFTVGP
ncbi:MAG: hypothetical protein S0880_14190 [Actinomycetota bacterium]|nr:hypothetical protein [Actinomycetota bacterium]